jgi:hypothetical protein
MSQMNEIDDGQPTPSAQDTGSQAMEAVQQRAEVAREEVANVAHHATDDARQLAREATRHVRDRIDEQGAQVGNAMRQFGEDLSRMADSADDPDRPSARVVRQVGEQVGSVADQFERRGVDGLVGDVKQFARRHPGQFIFGALAAGFVAGRLVRNVDTGAIAEEMKASDDRPSSSDQAVIDLTGADQSAPPTPGQPGEYGVPAAPAPALGSSRAGGPVAGIAGEELGAW